ncbi:MAG: hypothetical protein QW371_01990 [Candidatus Bathyarchaeia archaeon]
MERILGLPLITAFVVFGLPALITLALIAWGLWFEAEGERA